MPLVSIVMPVYNGAAWLRPCLDSILCQTMDDFELIVVDDASADETPGILADYAARDARMSVVTHARNTHAGVARNDGMERATGTYLLFLDADDLYEPYLLERAVGCAQAGDADMVLFGADEFEGDPAHARPNPFLLYLSAVPDRRPFSCADVPDRLFQICTPEPWSKLFRRSFVEHAAPGGAPLRFQGMQNANDLFFTMAALAAAERVDVAPDVLVHHRKGTAGGVQSRKAQEPLAFLDALRALKAYLGHEGLFDRLSVSFANLAVFHCLFNDGAPADWPAVFAELGVSKLDRGQFAFPGDYERFVGMVIDSWGASSVDSACYGADFWREAALAYRAQAREAQEELDRVLGSMPLKLGLKLTWLPRAMKGLLGRD